MEGIIFEQSFLQVVQIISKYKIWESFEKCIEIHFESDSSTLSLDRSNFPRN